MDTFEIDVAEPRDDEDEDQEMFGFYANDGDDMYSACGLRIPR